MELLEIMRQVELFRGLNAEQLKEVAAIASREAYHQGDVIFDQGSVGDKMYVVDSGQVEVRVQPAAGDSFAVLFLGRGQVFGEMALIDAGRRSATLVAVEANTVVYSIPEPDFTRLCRTHTDIGYVMMRNIAQDLSFKLRHRDFDPSQS